MTNCSHPGCEFETFAHSLCDIHYLRKLRGERMDAPVRADDRPTAPEPKGRIKQTGRICAWQGCDRRRLRGSELCTAHRSRRKRGVDMDRPIRPYNQTGCRVEGCQRPHSCRGFCRRHYHRQYRQRATA